MLRLAVLIKRGYTGSARVHDPGEFSGQQQDAFVQPGRDVVKVNSERFRLIQPDQPVTLTVYWNDGSAERWSVDTVNQYVELRQATGESVTDEN